MVISVNLGTVNSEENRLIAALVLSVLQLEEL